MTREQLEAIANGPCRKRKDGLPHDDPDNSGQCIYCHCILDILDEDIDEYDDDDDGD